MWIVCCSSQLRELGRIQNGGIIVLLPAAVFVCKWWFLVTHLFGEVMLGLSPHNKLYWPIRGAPGAQLVGPCGAPYFPKPGGKSPIKIGVVYSSQS